MLSTLHGWTSSIDGIDDDMEFKARLASYLDCSDCASTMEEFLESLKKNETSVSDITQPLPTITPAPTMPDVSLSAPVEVKESTKLYRQAAIEKWLKKRAKALEKLKRENATRVNGRSIVAQQKQRINGRFVASEKIEWISATEFQAQIGPDGQPKVPVKKQRINSRPTTSSKVVWVPATEFNRRVREWEAAGTIPGMTC